MKQEEMSDIRTILIEATDERAEVMSQVSRQNKPLIIVLPEQASQVFCQPSDFYELKRLKRERGLSITLVIAGHERVRSMARRQGFQVYASTETCARAMARRDRLHAMRGISLSHTTGALQNATTVVARNNETDEEVPWSWEVNMQRQEAALEAHESSVEWMLADKQLWDKDWDLLLRGEYTQGNTPLPTLSTEALAAFADPSDERGAALRPLRLVGLHGASLEEDVSSVQSSYVRHTPITEPLGHILASQSPVEEKQPGSKLVLVLTILIILGILGGLGCSYALTLLHFSPVTLSFVNIV